MDSSALDPNELAAIRAAIAPASTPSRQAMPEGPTDAQPVALIADDRAAESARPNGLRIGTRWANSARAAILRLSGAKVEIDVLAADTVDASALRDELSGSWLRCVNVSGRRGSACPGMRTHGADRLRHAVGGAPDLQRLEQDVRHRLAR